MLWDEARSQIKDLTAQFIYGNRLDRWKAVQEHLGFESGDGQDRDPIEFLFALSVRGDARRNSPECGLYVMFHRRKGDPHAIRIHFALRSYLKDRGVPSRDITIRKAKRWFTPFQLPNPGCAVVLRGVCTAPSSGVRITTNGGAHGAICCFARSGGSESRSDLYAITTAHQLGDDASVVGREVLQPDPSDQNRYVIGTVTAARPIIQDQADPVDVAAIKIAKPQRALTDHLIGTRPQLQMGAPQASAAPATDREVCKLGPGNGLTLGRVDYVNASVALSGGAQNTTRIVVESGILVTGQPNEFSVAGDSGAPVFDRNTGELLAMVVGGMGKKETGGDTVCLPIGLALSALQLRAMI